MSSENSGDYCRWTRLNSQRAERENWRLHSTEGAVQPFRGCFHVRTNPESDLLVVIFNMAVNRFHSGNTLDP
jgi:hypothetical protein